jgi:O-antigen/teichoic acid export membrane protein
MTSSQVIARNSLLNVAGQVIPMLAALIAIPILIQHLGPARFGVLTLAWAAIGYFNLFDLGLGRALTQAIATRLGGAHSTHELGTLAWTALALMVILGIIGGLILAALTPWIVDRGLNIPPALLLDSLRVFYLLAASLPFVVSTAGLRGLLEAHQQFGTVTVLRIPLVLFTFLGPVAMLPFSDGLVPIVAVLVVGRVATWAAHLVVCVRRYDYLRHRMSIRRDAVTPLLRIGGWMTLSNVVSPIMAYLDRFFIGAILPLSAVAHYVTPYELVTRLLVVPQGIVVALFPAFATTYTHDRERTAALFERSARVVLLLMFPPLLGVVLFAREGLSLWVGAAVAVQSTAVLQWLAVGVFLNSLAQAPFVVLQSTGRPDLTARLHLAELPIYLAALWWLTDRYGLVGVAMAWSVRAAVDTTALFLLAARHLPTTASQTRTMLFIALGVSVVLGAGMRLDTEPLAKAGYLLATLIGFVVFGWMLLVRPLERETLLGWTRARARSFASRS